MRQRWVDWAALAGAIVGLAACGVDRSPLDANPAAGFSGSNSSGSGGSSGVGGVGGVGGVAGFSGVGGVAGVAGSAGIGGVGGVAGSGGFSGIGGSGGLGGVGGVGGALMCNSSNDIRTGSVCEQAAQGWFAIRTTLDVWWAGIPTRDPGRGDIIIYLLAKLTEVCPDGSNANVEIKACGARLPPFTSDVACDAFQIEFPDEIWESAKMPRFHTFGSTTAFAPGGILSIARTTGLVGIDLLDGSEDGTWPTSMQTDRFPCENGVGDACFPDHDDDDAAGITIRIRSDGAVYTGPYDSGTCSTGTPYRYRGAPTGPDPAAGGGAAGGVRAVKVQIGLRTRLSGAGEIDPACSRGVGDSTADFLDSRALDCIVDPDSLPEPSFIDDRKQTGNYDCTDGESQFVDDNVPNYRVLQAGGVPGASNRPTGWTPNPLNGFLDRDIPRHQSVGPKSALVRLADLIEPEPSCQTVRDLAYPNQ